MSDEEGKAGSPIDELAEARLLSSFVPVLMLKAMGSSSAAIEPPMTQDYEAVALFAVRAPLACATLPSL